MSAPHSRVIQQSNAPSDTAAGSFPATSGPSHETVVVSAGETLALLMHAARRDRAWLSDFADETIRVSRDMYEVLLHYKQLMRKENGRA